jgi:hypothetical protein
MTAGGAHPLHLLWSAPRSRTAAQRALLARHLAGCAPCREEAAVLASVARSLRAQAELDHIPIEDLMRLHDAERGLDPSHRDAMRGHLRECPSCADDFDALTRAGRSSWAHRLAGVRSWGPAAAAALAVLLAGAGIAGNLFAPAARAHPAEIVLQAPRRSTATVPGVRAERAHTFRILLPLDAGPGPFLVRLAEQSSPAREDGDLLAHAGPDGRLVVSLRAPAPGRCRIEVRPASGSAEAIIYPLEAIR